MGLLDTLGAAGPLGLPIGVWGGVGAGALALGVYVNSHRQAQPTTTDPTAIMDASTLDTGQAGQTYYQNYGAIIASPPPRRGKVHYSSVPPVPVAAGLPGTIASIKGQAVQVPPVLGGSGKTISTVPPVAIKYGGQLHGVPIEPSGRPRSPVKSGGAIPPALKIRVTNVPPVQSGHGAASGARPMPPLTQPTGNNIKQPGPVPAVRRR